eukprot:6747309-Lingulodinium_polyedra.AAC.1
MAVPQNTTNKHATIQMICNAWRALSRCIATPRHPEPHATTNNPNGHSDSKRYCIASCCEPANA